MKRLLLLTGALLLFVSVALPSTIVYTSPNAYAWHDMVALPDFNATYATPKTFVLPDATTMASFLISAPPASYGTPFSVWLDNQNDLGSRLYVFNIQDSLPTFIGLGSTTAMSRIILTTPTNGYSFTISNFQGGPVTMDPPPPPPDPIDPPPTEGEVPELGTLALLGSGLIAISKFRAKALRTQAL